MLNALDYSIDEWKEILKGYGEPSFRAAQLFKWLHKGVGFDGMTNLPGQLTERLKNVYTTEGAVIHKRLVSEKDGTRKYLFALCDGNMVEGVLMSYKYGNTVCISTQAGCRMNCAFCASGIDGLVRNLSAGEMLGEVLAVNRDISPGGERAIGNIVLMGSGEPLDNYDNVLKFLELVNRADGLNVSRRNISLSTCGLCDKIRALADEGGGVTLTVSLHAPNDTLRESIMPINRKYKLAELMKSVRYYFEKTGRRIIFEYSMIRGVNDSIKCARELAALLKGLPAHVNLINLNYVREKGLNGSSNESVRDFLAELERLGVSATLRRTMGGDIDGACGQLRRRVMEESEKNGN